MKQRIFFCIVFLLFIPCIKSFAQKNEQPNRSFSFVASKNHTEKKYLTGTRLSLLYKSDSNIKKIKGIYTGVISGKIVIKRKKRSAEQIVIRPEQIIALRKIDVGTRIILGSVGGAMLIGGAAIAENLTVLGILLAGPGTFMILAVPVTIGMEYLNQKTAKDGWIFSIHQ
jgi:hypothetical protein